MAKKKPKARMGRPPVPVDKLRPHKYKVSLTHRDQYLLKKFNEELRPDLSPASYIRLLAHHMLEVMEDKEHGMAEMLAEQVYADGVKAGASQAEIDFLTGEVHRDALDTMRSPDLERRMNDGLKIAKAKKDLKFTPSPSQ